MCILFTGTVFSNDLTSPDANFKMKFSIKEISDRLGHESPETTWKVYAHLYPGKDRKLADALNEVRATNDNVEDKNE